MWVTEEAQGLGWPHLVSWESSWKIPGVEVQGQICLDRILPYLHSEARNKYLKNVIIVIVVRNYFTARTDARSHYCKFKS